MASREDVHRGEIVGDALVALFLGFTAERLSLVGSPVKISLPPLQSGGGQKRTKQEIMAGLGIFALGYKTSSRHMQSPGYNFPPEHMHHQDILMIDLHAMVIEKMVIARF